MPAHGATCRLVGEHAVAVVLNIGNVVESTKQRAGIKNGHHAIGAVPAAILHHAGLYDGDAAIVFRAGFKVDDGPRPSTMRPENSFARVRHLYRALSFARRHS